MSVFATGCTLAIALGTPVRLIQISNQPITWLQLSVFTHLDMLKPGWSDLSGLGRVLGLSISKRGDVLGLSHSSISKFTENGPKTRKHPVSSWETPPEVQGEWTALSWQRQRSLQRPLITRRSPKPMGFSSRRPHRVPLLSAKNRKLKLQLTNTHQLKTHWGFLKKQKKPNANASFSQCFYFLVITSAVICASVACVGLAAAPMSHFFVCYVCSGTIVAWKQILIVWGLIHLFKQKSKFILSNKAARSQRQKEKAGVEECMNLGAFSRSDKADINIKRLGWALNWVSITATVASEDKHAHSF